MRRNAAIVWTGATSGLVSGLGWARVALAHGFGPHDNLPVPLWADIGDALRHAAAPNGAPQVVVWSLSLGVFALFVLQVYLIFCTWMAPLRGRRLARTRLALILACSLVPVAMAHHMAYDLSLLLTRASYLVRWLAAASGWRLHGFEMAVPPVAGVGATSGWSIPLATMVSGHLIAIYLARILALRLPRHHPLPWRGQRPMLVLMAGYAVLSLGSLASPAMESARHQTAATAPSLVSGGPASDQSPVLASATRARSLARVQELLTAVRPLQQAVDTTAEAEVKTTVLCYCLAAAPAAVRELRRLAANRFAQGIAAWQAHRHRDAITAFTKTLQLHPRNTWAYLNRGLAHARLGQYAQAQADLTSALAVDPQLTAAYYARGLVSILLGQVDRADGDIQRAAALGDPEARRVLQTFVHGAPEPAALGTVLVK